MEGIKSTMDSVSNSVSNVTSNVSNKVSNSLSSIPKPEINPPTLSSIGNPLEKTNTEKVMDKFSLSSTPSMTSSSGGLGYGFKFFLLFVIIVLLIVNLWAYLEKGTDVFSSKLRGIFVNTGDGVLDTLQKTFDNLVSGTRFGKGIIYDSVSSSINLMKSMLVTKFKKNEKVFIKQDSKGESKLESKIKKKEESEKKPEEDSSESNIQRHVKGNYCFVGNQTPHNACVEVSDTTKCMSGKLFKTLKECEGHNQMKWTQEE